MYKQHFGLTSVPLGKDTKSFWENKALVQFKERWQWLLESPGIGVLTGEPGVGKTAALRQVIEGLNPHQHQVIYMPETDFSRLDIYRTLACAFGIEPSFRRAKLWADIKERITELVDGKHLLPIWVIDEAHNLPKDFFDDFPAFLNFALDSEDKMTVWLVGHPNLNIILERASLAALASRIQVKVRLQPVVDKKLFFEMVQHGLKVAGCQQTLVSDSGIEIIRQASKGTPRLASKILETSMRLAVPKGLNHLPDELLEEAIEELR